MVTINGRAIAFILSLSISAKLNMLGLGLVKVKLGEVVDRSVAVKEALDLAALTDAEISDGSVKGLGVTTSDKGHTAINNYATLGVK